MTDSAMANTHATIDSQTWNETQSGSSSNVQSAEPLHEYHIRNWHVLISQVVNSCHNDIHGKKVHGNIDHCVHHRI